MIKRIPCRVVSSDEMRPFRKTVEPGQARTSFDLRSDKRDETANLDDDGEYYPTGLFVDVVIN